MRAHENPFRTSNVESKLQFQPHWLGTTWDSLETRFEKLRSTGHSCAVVGPHGSGKTTFLESLQTRLINQGHEVHYVRLFRMPDGDIMMSELPKASVGSILMLDSAGNYRRDHWKRLRVLMERCHVVETRHCSRFARILLETETRPEMLAACIRRLHPASTHSSEEVVRLFRRHRGNLRDALSECYESMSVR